MLHVLGINLLVAACLLAALLFNPNISSPAILSHTSLPHSVLHYMAVLHRNFYYCPKLISIYPIITPAVYLPFIKVIKL